MPGCVLHVNGKDFDPKPLLAKLSFAPYSVFQKGESQFPRIKGREEYPVGGFKCDVSPAGDLSNQVQAAISFLSLHQEDFLKLAADPSIERKCLDFGYECRLGQDVCAQFDYLPAELLRLCGELGLGIELSLYPPPSA